MSLSVTPLRTGPWGETCYLLRSAGDAVLIDPGGRPDDIVAAVEQQECTLHAVLLTHGHFDHVGAVGPVTKHFGVEAHMSSLDAPVLKQAKMLQFVFKSKEPVSPPRSWIDLGPTHRELRFGELVLEAIATPGHTPGGFVFRSGDALFTGDTLLAGKVGTAKLPGGDAADLAASVALLSSLEPTLRVFPGHGQEAPLSSYLDRRGDS